MQYVVAIRDKNLPIKHPDSVDVKEVEVPEVHQDKPIEYLCISLGVTEGQIIFCAPNDVAGHLLKNIRKWYAQIDDVPLREFVRAR